MSEARSDGQGSAILLPKAAEKALAALDPQEKSL